MKTTPLTAKRLLSLILLALVIFTSIVVVASAAVFSPMVWIYPLMILQGSTGSQPSQNERVIQEDLVFWLEIPAEVSIGTPVPIRLKVKNVGDYTINLSLGGDPSHDVVVTGQDDREIWRWSHWRYIHDSLLVTSLLPNEERVFEAEWSQRNSFGLPALPGTYRVRGILHTEPRQQLETEPKTLLITL